MANCEKLIEAKTAIAHSKAQILAVSKLQEVIKIRALYSCGQRDFGENYVQEALKKQVELKDLNDIRWHFIGTLQKNKVNQIVGKFDYIHSVDSIDLATKISTASDKMGLRQKVFLQLNLADEATKSGFHLERFGEDFQKLSELKGIDVVGLMTMPPLEISGDVAREYFRQLKKLGDSLNLREFSMGTSHDFKEAAAEGATWVRLGTSLFGERPKKELK